MQKFISTSTRIAGVCLVLPFFISADETNWQFHTTPDKWKDPRIFQTPFDREYESRVAISHEELTTDCELKILSPNKAYWFEIKPDEGYETWTSPTSGVRFHISSADAPIYVFNEHDRLIKILLKDHYPNFLLDVYWINQKLLYIKVWWGRVLGSCFIFDVEKESFIYREMVNDGNLPFQQWQQGKQK